MLSEQCGGCPCTSKVDNNTKKEKEEKERLNEDSLSHLFNVHSLQDFVGFVEDDMGESISFSFMRL